MSGIIMLFGFIYALVLAWIARTFLSGWFGGIALWIISAVFPITVAFILKGNSPDQANIIALFGPVALVSYPIFYWLLSRRA
jgi:hypothetical protein